jgi:5'-nucleotidase
MCALGKREQGLLRIEARTEGRGNRYCWVAFGRQTAAEARPGTDMRALAEKKIAVTPLRLDLTDEPFMTLLAGELT